MAEKYSITKKEEVYNLLKNKRNFEFMSESLLRKLIDVMKVVRFREEQLLIRQDQENSYCYIIITGSVSVYVDGKFLYKLRRTGDVFGEVSFVTQSASTASIKSDKDLGVIVISYKVFNQLHDIELCLWLARVIGEKLVRTSKLKQGTTPTQPKLKKPKQEESPPQETEDRPTEQPITGVADDSATEEKNQSEESTTDSPAAVEPVNNLESEEDSAQPDIPIINDDVDLEAPPDIESVIEAPDQNK